MEVRRISKRDVRRLVRCLTWPNVAVGALVVVLVPEELEDVAQVKRRNRFDQTNDGAQS